MLRRVICAPRRYPRELDQVQRQSKTAKSITLEKNQVRITSKGQVTIPVEIRERLGLLPNSEVEFEVEGNAVRIRRARGRPANARGRSIVDRLKGKATNTMTTDEIMALTRR